MTEQENNQMPQKQIAFVKNGKVEYILNPIESIFNILKDINSYTVVDSSENVGTDQEIRLGWEYNPEDGFTIPAGWRDPLAPEDQHIDPSA